MHWSVPLKQAFKHTISWKEALSQNKEKELSTELRKQKRFVLGHNKDLDWKSPPSPPASVSSQHMQTIRRVDLFSSCYFENPMITHMKMCKYWKSTDWKNGIL